MQEHVTNKQKLLSPREKNNHDKIWLATHRLPTEKMQKNPDGNHLHACIICLLGNLNIEWMLWRGPFGLQNQIIPKLYDGALIWRTAPRGMNPFSKVMLLKWHEKNA